MEESKRHWKLQFVRHSGREWIYFSNTTTLLLPPRIMARERKRVRFELQETTTPPRKRHCVDSEHECDDTLPSTWLGAPDLQAVVQGIQSDAEQCPFKSMQAWETLYLFSQEDFSALQAVPSDEASRQQRCLDIVLQCILCLDDFFGIEELVSPRVHQFRQAARRQHVQSVVQRQHCSEMPNTAEVSSRGARQLAWLVAKVNQAAAAAAAARMDHHVPICTATTTVVPAFQEVPNPLEDRPISPISF